MCRRFHRFANRTKELDRLRANGAVFNDLQTDFIAFQKCHSEKWFALDCQHFNFAFNTLKQKSDQV